MKLSCFSIDISLYLGVTNNQILLHFGVPDTCKLKYTELFVGNITKIEYNGVVFSMSMAQK